MASAESTRKNVGASPAPVNPPERIDSIDILRGLALLGVLAINVVLEFRVSIFEQFLPPQGELTPLDRTVGSILSVAVASKAFALFSLLFGVGLAIQFERLAGTPQRPVLLFRRLAVLLIFGLVHLFLIWNGDILTEYALAGLIALPLLYCRRWVLVSVSSALLALYLIEPFLRPIVPMPSMAWMAEHVVTAKAIYGTGGFLDILAFRIQELPFLLPLHIFVFPRTVALFLLGALAWRTGILRGASVNRPLLFSIAALSSFVGVGLELAGESDVAFRWPSSPEGRQAIANLATLLLAFGYAAIVIGAASLPRGKKALAWAAPLGRMAFTNYLAQSVLFGFIFYGYGLGLFGRLGISTALGIGALVYAAQVLFSAWWLKYYRFGPVEWLWRSLMYGKAQAMRQSRIGNV